MTKKIVEEIKNVVKSRKKKKSKIAKLADEEAKYVCEAYNQVNQVDFVATIAQTNKRIDRIVAAIHNSKSVKGL